MTTTTGCVSLTTGTLAPDERVNYTFGMVLGLDEFQQEQTYGLFKDRLHERTLHGYGTVSGLKVAVTPVDSDYQVSVSTGIGVDQWGREFAITCEQCARIGSWLAVQEAAGHGLGEHAPGPSGEVTVYVVANYQQCLTDEVPIPSSPCSTGPSSAPSRIRDVWDVELSWTPPPMPRWDSDRRLARLLARVTVVTDLDPTLSDEAKITAAVRDLVALAAADTGLDTELDPPPVGSPPEPPNWKLPADEAPAALDRILTVWVTEVRPTLAQDLYEPENTGAAAPGKVPAPPAVLLSTITFVPAPNFSEDAPVISWCADPDDDGRPYLLHSQLIQELSMLLGGSEETAEVPATELVTLSAGADENAAVTIDAWFHLPEGVLLPPTLTVIDEDGSTMDYQTAGSNGTDAAARWRLTSAPNGTSGIQDGLQFSVLFPADTVHVGDATTTLRDYVTTTGINLLDQDSNGDVTAYGVIRMAAHPVPVATPQPFATVTPITSNSDMSVFEFWFHLEPIGQQDDVVVGDVAIEVFDDWSTNTGQPGQLNLTQAPASSGWSNARLVRVVPGPTSRGNAQYLRFVFPTGQFAIKAPDGTATLHDWIEKTGVNYAGWDQSADEIVVFARPPITQTAAQLKSLVAKFDASPDGGGGQ